MADNVRAVILDTKAKFLILTELDDPDNWKLPGGKVDHGESPEGAIKRELLEELSLDLDDILKLQKPSLNPQTSFSYKQLVTDDGASSRFIFKIIVDPALIKPNKKEIARTMWCNKSSVPDCQNKNHILKALESVT